MWEFIKQNRKTVLGFICGISIGSIFITLIILNPYLRNIIRYFPDFIQGRPIPGSCQILEEKYCKQIILIKNPNNLDRVLAAIKVPARTVLFAPVTGDYSHTPTFFFKNPESGQYTKYPGSAVANSQDGHARTVSAHYAFIYFKEKSNATSLRIKQGKIIGKISDKNIDFLGDYNLIFGTTKQTYVNNKAAYQDNTPELKSILNIK